MSSGEPGGSSLFLLNGASLPSSRLLLWVGDSRELVVVWRDRKPDSGIRVLPGSKYHVNRGEVRCALYRTHPGPLGVLTPIGVKEVEDLRTRVGVVCERECFLCLSASANRKKVAAVLPYGFSWSNLREDMHELI